MISAVGALRNVYRRQGESGLTWVLGTLREVWGNDRSAYDGSMIQGFAQLLEKHMGTLDRHRLVTTTAKKYTPGRLIGAARTARDMFKGSMPANIVQILEANYNHNLRNGARLES